MNEKNLVPPGLSHTSNINSVEDNENDNNIFMDYDGLPSLYDTNALSNHVSNPYGYLKPYFSQMID